MFYRVSAIVDEKASGCPVVEYNFKKLGYVEVNEPPLTATEEPADDVVLPPYRLVRNATLYDVLSGYGFTNAWGLVVNKKFKECAIKLKTPKLYFHKLDLEDSKDNSITEYYYMQVIMKESIIDYDKSNFSIIKLLKEVGETKVGSEEEFVSKNRELLKERKRMKPKSLKLNSSYNDMDFFFLKNSGIVDFILTERGKSILESDGISGLDYRPFEVIA